MAPDGQRSNNIPPPLAGDKKRNRQYTTMRNNSLQKCCRIVKAEAAKTNDEQLERNMQRFESCYAGEWHDSISAGTGKSATMAKMNKPKLIVSLDDVEKGIDALNADLSSTEYVTLAQACPFNRKRGGELLRMKVADAKFNRKMSTPDQ